MPKAKSKEEKELIISTHSKFTEEKQKIQDNIKSGQLDAGSIPFQWENVTKRTSATLNVSEKTVQRIVREMRTAGTVGQPSLKSTGRKKIHIDSFTEGVIRRAVLEAYSKRIYPTLGYLHQYLQDDPNFPRMCKATLHNIMRRQLKFKFGKFNGRPVAMDRPDIAAHRAKYLRQIKKYRRNGYHIYYQDESWVTEGMGIEKGWHIPEKEVIGMGHSRPHRDPWLRGIGHRFQEGLLGGISPKPSGAGKRLVLLDIGSADGFLGVGKVFLGNNKSSDYHGEMTAEHFNAWFRDVVAIIPNKSVIVLDQASYHRKVTEETRNPTTSYRKAELIAWLENKGVPIPTDEESFWDMTVVELLELAKKFPVEPVFEAEKIISDAMTVDPTRDIKLLWLPVAHCEFNPIELMWAAIKGAVRKRNVTFKLKDLLPLTKEVINSDEIIQLWPACCRHVEELEDLIMEREKIAEDFMRNTIQPIIIELGNGSSDSSDSDISFDDSDSED